MPRAARRVPAGLPELPPAPAGPPRPTESDYLAALLDACPPDTWRAVCARAVADAEAGDPRARAWLAGYLIGQPDRTVTHTLDLAVDAATGEDPIARKVRLVARARRQQQDQDALEERLRPLFGG